MDRIMVMCKLVLRLLLAMVVMGTEVIVEMVIMEMVVVMLLLCRIGRLLVSLGMDPVMAMVMAMRPVMGTVRDHLQSWDPFL